MLIKHRKIKALLALCCAALLLLPACSSSDGGKTEEDGKEGGKKDAGGITTLREAMDKGDMKALEALLENGADPNEPLDFYGYPLVMACQNGRVHSGHNLPAVKLLLEHGADPDLGAPLCDAIRGTVTVNTYNAGQEKNFYEICNLLLEKGADPDGQDGDRLTPLLYAAGQASALGRGDGIPALLQSLLDRGADPFAVTEDHRDALMLACGAPGTDGGIRRNISPEAIQVLLDAGLNPNAIDDDGLTALDYAQHMYESNKDGIGEETFDPDEYEQHYAKVFDLLTAAQASSPQWTDPELLPYNAVETPDWESQPVNALGATYEAPAGWTVTEQGDSRMVYAPPSGKAELRVSVSQFDLNPLAGTIGEQEFQEYSARFVEATHKEWPWSKNIFFYDSSLPLRAFDNPMPLSDEGTPILMAVARLYQKEGPSGRLTSYWVPLDSWTAQIDLIVWDDAPAQETDPYQVLCYLAQTIAMTPDANSFTTSDNLTGAWQDGRYENAALNMGFDLPEGWKIVEQVPADMVEIAGATQCAAVQNAEGTVTVRLSVVEGEARDELTFMNDLRQPFRGKDTSSAEADPFEKEFGGQTYLWQSISLFEKDLTIELVAIRKQGDNMVVLTALTDPPSQNKANDVMRSWSKLS